MTTILLGTVSCVPKVMGLILWHFHHTRAIKHSHWTYQCLDHSSLSSTRQQTVGCWSKTITIYQMAELMGTAWQKAATLLNITAGFRVSGIWPFDRNAFDMAGYLPSTVTDRELPEKEPMSVDLPAVNNVPAIDQSPAIVDQSVDQPCQHHYVHLQIHSLAEFCQVQNSLCVQVLCSPILAASLHGTPAAHCKV